MLRMAYIHFMQELQKELNKAVGPPFQCKIDIQIGIGDPNNKQKLEEFVKNTLQPIMKEMPEKVVMS